MVAKYNIGILANFNSFWYITIAKTPNYIKCKIAHLLENRKVIKLANLSVYSVFDASLFCRVS